MKVLLWSLLIFACALSLLGGGATRAAEAGGPWVLGNIVVEQAWARRVPGGARTGVVYLTVHNKSGVEDLLLAVDSSAAKTTAVHATVVDNGVASMSPLPGGLLLPSHGEVVMRPGGIHIMLTGLPDSLTAGGNLPVKMVFRDAGPLEFEVPVIPLSAGDPTEQHVKH